MILANDLRKGNWIKAGDKTGRVTQLLWNRIELVVDQNGSIIYEEIEYSKLEPIGLTPELVQRCGFYKHELFPHRNAFHHKKFIFNINIVANTYEVSYGLIAQNVAIIYQKTLYLHQLQNLFYLLTGEELKIEL